MVNQGYQFVMVAEQPGSHRLEFELAAKVTTAGPWQQIEFVATD